MLKEFRKSEHGGITALAIFLVLMIFVLIGISVDVSNAYKVRTQLQIAADAAAHAALYNRETEGEAGARQKAVQLAAEILEVEPENAILRAEDIRYGNWNPYTRTFTESIFDVSAVQVLASRDHLRENPVQTFLLGFIGLDAWDIGAIAVVETAHPLCLREGFVGDGIVDIQSNNAFYNGFCLHSNTHVSVNQNNIFEEGTVVSMPLYGDETLLEKLDAPASVCESNDGLCEALTESFYNIRILNRVDDIVAAMQSGDIEKLPDYVTETGKTPTWISGSTLSMAGNGLTPGSVYRLACDKGKKVTLQNDSVFTGVVLIADCELAFAQGVELNDVVIVNMDTSAKSINAPSGLQLGKDDGCAEHGGAQIVTMGGVDVASDLRMYGGQIIAKGNVYFAANANGLAGASIISAGEISGTSNMTMGFCGTGMEDNFEVDYFRTVM